MPAQPASTISPQTWSSDYLGNLAQILLLTFTKKRHLEGSLLTDCSTKLDAGTAGIHSWPPNLVTGLPRHLRIFDVRIFLHKAPSEGYFTKLSRWKNRWRRSCAVGLHSHPPTLVSGLSRRLGIFDVVIFCTKRHLPAPKFGQWTT